MAASFSLSIDPHNQPKLLSFLKPCCFSSSSSPLPLNDDEGAADDSYLNSHHVIILEIRQRAMMKARSQPRSSFMIMTAQELGRLIKAARASKSDDAEERRKKEGEYEGDEEKDDEFFSVRSCFSLCSSKGDEEEWLRDCEGWPFGLWRRRKVVALPPLPKSPADSWTWHKRNLSYVKV